MGLGKTLQSITLLWTLLNSGNDLLGGKPIAKRVIICCPTSLVSNWDSEIQKWLKVQAAQLSIACKAAAMTFGWSQQQPCSYAGPLANTSIVRVLQR